MTTITNVRERRISIADLLDLRALTGGNVAEANSLAKMIRGFEEGYNEVEDLITETSDGFPLGGMWAEFQRTIALWNRQRDALTNILTFRVSDPVEGVRYPIEQDFQEATEFGEPTGIRLGPSYRHGYDFKWYDLAIRYTWQYLAEASAEQLRALHSTALEADNRLVFTKILRAIFNNVTRTAEIDGDNINVYPFYNGDSLVPPKWKTTTFSTGHDHYLTSGAAVVDSADLDDLIAHITEHGYTVQRGSRIVILVNEQEADVIRQFTTVDGDKFTFIPSTNNVSGGVILPAGQIIGQPTVSNFAGLETIGTYGVATIVKEDYIPAGYMLGFATGGEDNISNPVGIREHEKASLRGLRLVKGRTPDYPLIDSFYLHGMGTGVRHRGAGAVMQITAGSYSIPSDYA